MAGSTRPYVAGFTRPVTPIARSVPVVLMPPALDAYVFYAGGSSSWFAYSLILSITLLQTLALLSSLLVVRSCGYRLVRRDKNAATALSTQTPPSSETGTHQ